MHAGLSPEYINVLPSKVASVEQQDFTTGAAYYMLRPETMESLYILWQVTGDPRYQHWAWSMFEAFERHCKVGLRCNRCDPVCTWCARHRLQHHGIGMQQSCCHMCRRALSK